MYAHLSSEVEKDFTVSGLFAISISGGEASGGLGDLFILFFKQLSINLPDIYFQKINLKPSKTLVQSFERVK